MNRIHLSATVILGAVLSVMVTSCRKHAQGIYDMKVDSRMTGEGTNVKVYLPRDYNHREAYPLLITSDEKEFLAGGYAQVLDSLIGHGIIVPVVAACPETALKSGSEAFFMDDMIPALVERYNVSADRADHIYYGVAAGADLGIALSMGWQDMCAEYWCLSPSKARVSDMVMVEQNTMYRICWGAKDEVMAGFTYYQQLVGGIRKRGGKVRNWSFEGNGNTVKWREEFIRLVVQRFGVEEL